MYRSSLRLWEELAYEWAWDGWWWCAVCYHFFTNNLCLKKFVGAHKHFLRATVYKQVRVKIFFLVRLKPPNGGKETEQKQQEDSWRRSEIEIHSVKDDNDGYWDGSYKMFLTCAARCEALVLFWLFSSFPCKELRLHDFLPRAAALVYIWVKLRARCSIENLVVFTTTWKQ